uniref:LAGLIDADG endonuclease n=1 Tax=Powellomyces hirtus TaxID=109895 RepID=A0A4P8NQS1_9FUNG|nr:LAGLIDADG endonuclease [Powellomyces hirtus]
MNMNYFLVMDMLVNNPTWLSGLIDGEGSFQVGVNKRVSSAGREYYVVNTTFYLGLHTMDHYVLEAVRDYLHCGYIYQKGPAFCSFEIKAKGDLSSYLFPHLDKYPLCGSKRLDYLDFRNVADMVSKKQHLTPEGLEEIRVIKAGMNNARRKNFMSCVQKGLI